MGQLATKLISSILDEELKSGEGGGDHYVCVWQQEEGFG